MYFFFKALNIPSEDGQPVAELERDLSGMGIASAIKAMQTGKSPGLDGFPADFFKSLPPTMHQAVISLLLKKDIYLIFLMAPKVLLSLGVEKVFD